MAGCAGLADGGTNSSRDGVLGVGDTWTLRVTNVEHGDDDGYTITLTQAIVARTVRNGTDAFEIHTTFEFPQEFQRPGRTFERTETDWLRVSDLAHLEQVAHTKSVLFPSEYPDSAGTYLGESTRVHSPPCANLVTADLEVGAQWNVTCQIRGASVDHGRDGDAEDRHEYTKEEVKQYHVEAREIVRVEAGVFTTYRVTSTTDDPRTSDDRASATTWVADGSCFPVPVRIESEYENTEHGGTAITELVDVDC